MTGLTIHGIPRPPSSNNMFVNVKGRGRVKSKRYKAWWTQAYYYVKANAPNALVAVARPVMVNITVKRRGPKVGDIDNMIKPVLDLLVTTGILEDDHLVQEVRARWGQAEDVTVSICAIPSPKRAEKGDDCCLKPGSRLHKKWLSVFAASKGNSQLCLFRDPRHERCCVG